MGRALGLGVLFLAALNFHEERKMDILKQVVVVIDGTYIHISIQGRILEASGRFGMFGWRSVVHEVVLS